MTDNNSLNTIQDVNPQILDAVKQSTQFAFGKGSGVSDQTEGLSAGKEIAFNKVAQAVSYAVQDATDYQRNMMTILTTVQGQAFALMFADQSKIPQCTLILEAATTQMTAVEATFAKVATDASTALGKF